MTDLGKIIEFFGEGHTLKQTAYQYIRFVSDR